MGFALRLAAETWALFFQMAPYLLLGFLVSGLLYAYLPKDALTRHLGKPGILPVLKAAVFGVPLPLCSCGVIPAALSLRKSGASRGATVSFLISTPQTGVDSILATYSLLGGYLALMRPIFSTLTAIAAGVLTNLFDRGEPAPPPDDAHAHEPHEAEAAPPLFKAPGRLRKAVSYGLRDHLSGVYRWLLVGLVLAGALSLVLPTKIPQKDISEREDVRPSTLFFRSFGIQVADAVVGEPRTPAGTWFRGFLIAHNELLCMGLMILIGIPLYICATGSIPIVMSMMQAGLSPGAGFVFLLAGPATNVTTLVMSWKYLGRRTTLIYLSAIVGISLLAGFAINGLAPYHGFLSKPAPHACHDEHNPWAFLGWFCALVMAGAILAVAWVDVRMAWRARFGGGPSTPRSLTIPVDGMTCGHCKATVEGALRGLPGVARAEANVSANRVEVVLTGGGPSLSRLRQAIEEAGYQVPGVIPEAPRNGAGAGAPPTPGAS